MPKKYPPPEYLSGAFPHAQKTPLLVSTASVSGLTTLTSSQNTLTFGLNTLISGSSVRTNGSSGRTNGSAGRTNGVKVITSGALVRTNESAGRTNGSLVRTNTVKITAFRAKIAVFLQKTRVYTPETPASAAAVGGTGAGIETGRRETPVFRTAHKEDGYGA
jgi:hypothetical protein